MLEIEFKASPLNPKDWTLTKSSKFFNLEVAPFYAIILRFSSSIPVPLSFTSIDVLP